MNSMRNFMHKMGVFNYFKVEGNSDIAPEDSASNMSRNSLAMYLAMK